MDSGTFDRRFIDRVEFVLKRQVDIATQEHHNAMFEFWQRRIDADDGGDPREVQEFEKRKNTAREALVLALKRSNAFTLNGTVPKDLEFLMDTGKGAIEASVLRA
jgi:hypothetical protein